MCLLLLYKFPLFTIHYYLFTIPIYRSNGAINRNLSICWPMEGKCRRLYPREGIIYMRDVQKKHLFHRWICDIMEVYRSSFKKRTYSTDNKETEYEIRYCGTAQCGQVYSV